ncbi:MAG: hypothetical protein KY439_10390 [Actinobacteria bacterium]|nr:hypothetical protein [Actinomycetota bacterium]
MKRWMGPLAVFAGLGVAAFLLVLGFQSKSEEPVAVRRVGLVRVFPEPETVAVRQGSVGAELSFGYEGRLRIDRVDIPDDQLDRISGINRLSFTPGADKEIPDLAEGRHCATVIFWAAATGPDSAGRPYTWCFTAA